MANHVRQQLRESVGAVLTGLTTTGARVYQSRVYPFQTTDLPCLVITTDGDAVEYLVLKHPGQQQRDTQVRIEAYAKATSNLDDTLDTICKEVEIALANSDIKNILLKGTQIDMEVLGDQPVGKATLIYNKVLHTVSNAPDSAL